MISAASDKESSLIHRVIMSGLNGVNATVHVLWTYKWRAHNLHPKTSKIKNS